jgi:amidase
MKNSLLRSIWDIQSGAAPRDAGLRAASARAESLEPWLHAFYVLADALQASETGPLAGIPVGVKDIIATAGMKTTNGSPIYAEHVPEHDAWIVAETKRLGGTVFGKTVTTEFAWRHPGPTVNPWNPAYTPGGSSSGSAAAVAAGILPLAFGTQTMGSIIRPAAYCGTVGYKPSFGSIPRDGVHPLAGSLDHVGFFTATAADAAAAHALFIERHPASVLSEAAWAQHFPAIRPPRLAVIRTGYWQRAEAEQRENFEAALQRFSASGAELTEFELPEDTALIVNSANLMLEYEAARIYAPLVERFPGKTSERLKHLVAAGMAVGEQRYQAALTLQAQLRADLGAWIAPRDAIVTLPATGQAPYGLEETGDASFCAPWTLAGVPAVSIPSGWTRAGLPLGLQIAGPFGADLTTLAVAAWAEAALQCPERTVTAA